MSKYRKINWPEVLEQYRTGNQSVEDFCKGKDIHPNSFYRNRKKYQESELVRIKVEPKILHESNPLELQIHDFILRIPKDFDPEALKAILRILKGLV